MTQPTPWSKHQFLDSILYRSHLGIVVTRVPQGRIVAVNEAFCKLLGYREDELLEKTLFDITHPDDLAETTARYHCFASGIAKSRVFENRYLGKSGDTIWASLSYALVDGENQGSLTVVVVTDISDRKQTLAALEASENRFHLLAENAPGVIFQCLNDEDLTPLYLNKAAHDLTGHTVKDFLRGDVRLQQFIRPGDFNRLLTEIRSAIGNMRPFDTTFQYQRRDGEWRWARIIGAAAVTQKRVKYLQGFITDITALVRTDELLRENRAFLAKVMETATNGIVALDNNGCITYANARVQDLSGIEPRELIGRKFSEMLIDCKTENLCHMFRRVLDTGAEFRDEEGSFRHVDGNLRYLSLSAAPIMAGEKATGLVVTIEDVTARRSAEIKLSHASAVFESTTEAIMITDRDVHILGVNPAFSKITGFSEAEVLGHKPSILRSNRHDSKFFKSVWAEMLEQGYWRGEVWQRRKDGETFPAWLSISVVTDSDKQISHYVGVFSDLGDIKRSQEKAEFLTHHDALTSLPNRLLMQTRLDYSIERARRDRSRMGVLLLDLDRFKNVNDSLGHGIGDRLLQEIGNRLQVTIREEDTAARIGDDEFVILIEQLADEQHIALVAEKLMQAVSRCITVDEHRLYSTASIGISVFPLDGKDGDTLLRNADAAMHRAKEEGRNNFQFYTKELTTAAQERMTLEADLRHAWDRGELAVHYQPQYCLKTGELLGAEALLRWIHSTLGPIPPCKFIPLAEEIGMIEPIGAWVLEKACWTARAWQTSGYPLKKVAVNLSVHQIKNPAIVSTVMDTLKKTGLDPSCLELEVTEGFIMQEEEHAISVLETLKDLGVALAIDDFGTGYSSLSYLKRLPTDKLKIDRSFVMDIPDDPNDEAIAKAIIALGHSLGMIITAEGVETVEQEAFLQSQHCDQGQGYLYRPAVPKEELLALPANKTLLTNPRDYGESPSSY